MVIYLSDVYIYMSTKENINVNEQNLMKKIQLNLTIQQ